MFKLEAKRVKAPLFKIDTPGAFEYRPSRKPFPNPGRFSIFEERDRVMHHGANMELTFKVADLLKILKKNLKEHKQIVKEAKAGYKKALVDELRTMLAKAKKGENFDRHIRSSPPNDNSRDYERTIRMLEMTVDEEIDLTGDQFECYVMDRWHWQESFLTSNTMYSSVASAKLMSM